MSNGTLLQKLSCVTWIKNWLCNIKLMHHDTHDLVDLSTPWVLHRSSNGGVELYKSKGKHYDTHLFLHLLITLLLQLYIKDHQWCFNSKIRLPQYKLELSYNKSLVIFKLFNKTFLSLWFKSPRPLSVKWKKKNT